LHQAGTIGSHDDEKLLSRTVQTLAVMSGTHVKTAVALVLAFASTTLVSIAYLREHAAVGALPTLSFGRPIQSLRLLLSSRPWLTGFAMESRDSRCM
jgi:hypothetical protein